MTGCPNDIVDAAIAYAGMGLKPVNDFGVAYGVCECGYKSCKSPGKHPPSSGWREKASSNAMLTLLNFQPPVGNVALYMSGTHVAFDADTADGICTLQSWHPPHTLTERTARGWHLIYKLSSHHVHEHIQDRHVAPGLEVKCHGKITVAPSMHVTGVRYRNVRWMPPTVLPDSLYDRIKRIPPPPRQHVPAGASPGFDRVRAYVMVMPEAVSGAGGHAALFAVANVITHNGLSSVDEWAIIKEYNATKCKPEWTDAELGYKLRSARKHGRGRMLGDRR